MSLLSIQGNSIAMERLRSDFGDKYMTMLEINGVEPNLPFIEKIVKEYGLSVTVGKLTYSPESDCCPFTKLDYDHFGCDYDGEEDFDGED